MRRHLSFANVTSVIALVFAMGGTAIAAHHYLLSSESQIKPSLLKQLEGSIGAAGPAGSAGQNGSNGSNGSQGPAGPAGPGFLRTVIVSPVGTAAQNGTELLNAMSGITASASDPALILIEPGVYNLNTTTLVGKPYVDIEGSGEDVTTIEANVASLTNGFAVEQSDNSTISSLSVLDSTASTTTPPGGIHDEGGPATLRDVYVDVTEPSGNATAFQAIGGPPGTTGTFTLIDVTAIATGGGASGATDFAYVGLNAGTNALIDGGSFSATTSGPSSLATGIGAEDLTASDVSASANATTSRAVWTEGTSTIASSTLDPGNVYIQSGTLAIGASEVFGVSTGTPTCVDDWSASFAALNTSCG
jgi:hypothetical protein